ncbi:MobC family plasmid mobilization relaxosome protein [Listeria booriae]|uniref:plasmid mobilization protein n=1 Tax=Listeria booriae TaxID=1552123 RepID=UPI00162A13FC|nr:plasmid mobilization relaxosome protein MobC [Listeria booriae]MBC1890076.1 MobC family plasmid mobilization relaxosome protein [Listeria booriae]
MASDRTIQKKFYVSEYESTNIHKKMAMVPTANFSDYARKMTMHGKVVHKDFSILKKLIGELGRIGNNINQIAHRTNETNNFFKQDLHELRKEYAELMEVVNEYLVELIHED